MAYSHELIGNIGVDDESNGGRPLNVGVGIDSLDMCTITFGTSFSLRIPAEDVDKLRKILHDASRKMDYKRANRELNEGMNKLRNALQM